MDKRRVTPPEQTANNVIGSPPNTGLANFSFSSPDQQGVGTSPASPGGNNNSTAAFLKLILNKDDDDGVTKAESSPIEEQNAVTKTESTPDVLKPPPLDESVLDQVSCWFGPRQPERDVHSLSLEVKQPLIEMINRWNQWHVGRFDEKKWDVSSRHSAHWPCIRSMRVDGASNATRDTYGYACNSCAERRSFCIRARGLKQVPLVVPLPPTKRRKVNDPDDLRFWIMPEKQ
ncbi:MAG: hypothetical protein Q9162_002976 [Coniocarpon cinnabarinum]